MWGLRSVGNLTRSTQIRLALSADNRFRSHLLTSAVTAVTFTQSPVNPTTQFLKIISNQRGRRLLLDSPQQRPRTTSEDPEATQSPEVPPKDVHSTTESLDQLLTSSRLCISEIASRYAEFAGLVTAGVKGVVTYELIIILLQLALRHERHHMPLRRWK